MDSVNLYKQISNGFNSVQFRLGQVLDLFTEHQMCLLKKVACEDPVSYFKTATKNLSYFLLNEAIFPRDKGIKS